MKQKIFLFTLGVLVVVFSLVACGRSEGDLSQPPPSEPDMQTPAPSIDEPIAPDEPIASDAPIGGYGIDIGNLTIHVGGDSSFVILPNGSLWAWGANISEFGMGGWLGDGTTVDRHSPVWIMDDVIYVSSSGLHTMAIRTDGSLWGWGFNGDLMGLPFTEGMGGQIGDGTTIDRLSPVWVMDDVVSVSAGSSHTLAVQSDGSLWAWGWNPDGRIGDGTANRLEGIPLTVVENNNRHYPVRIMENVVAASAGGEHSMAIRTDGSLYAWGSNSLGQLGDGTTIARHSPVRVMENVVAVSAKDIYTMAVQSDGSLWTWGWNWRGRLGNGEVGTSHTSPIKILDNVMSISTGFAFAAAIRTDGSLWAWGENFSGQIGIGTLTDQPTPIQVMDNVSAVSAGQNHILAIQENGNIWAWGRNHQGQFGNGSIAESQRSPLRITEYVLNIIRN